MASLLLVIVSLAHTQWPLGWTSTPRVASTTNTCHNFLPKPNVTVPCLQREWRRSVHQEERAPSCPPGQTVSHGSGTRCMTKTATYFIDKQEKVLIAGVEVGFRDSTY